MTDSSAFGAPIYAVEEDFIQIPIAIANDLSGTITSFGK